VPLRDRNWEGINHKDFPAIYPPAAQLLFRLIDAVYPHAYAFKVAFVLFDLGVVLLLMQLARLYRMEHRHVVLYALNPLVLLYVAGEGHLDATYLFFLVTALLAAKRGRDGWAFFFLGTGFMFKLVPLFFLPLFLQRKNGKRAFLFLPPLLLATPYLLGGAGLAARPLVFAGTFYYNGFLHSLFTLMLNPQVAQACCWMVFLFAWITLIFLVPHLLRAAYLLAALLLLCSPIMHQWYFLLVVVFLPFFRSPAWLLLMVTVSATFTTRFQQYDTGVWIDYSWARCIEYLPFVFVAVVTFLRGRRWGPERFPGPESLSVIVPVLNESLAVDACLDALRRQTFSPREVIVVDGGSTDGTLARLEGREDLVLVRAEKGRGLQVVEGLKEANGDVVLVLHADARLEPESMGRVMQALDRERSAVGGAMGSRYGDGAMRYRVIAALDNFRAGVLGVSFGNQGQFFRRAEVSYPDFLLMEDVELSFRMKEKGAQVFLPCGIANVTRRWKKVGYLRNIALILNLVLRFVVRRRLGRIEDRLEDFYRKYYG
jgi:hypothetical protein